jgi:hypothetical protein
VLAPAGLAAAVAVAVSTDDKPWVEADSRPCDGTFERSAAEADWMVSSAFQAAWLTTRPADRPAATGSESVRVSVPAYWLRMPRCCPS